MPDPRHVEAPLPAIPRGRAISVHFWPGMNCHKNVGLTTEPHRNDANPANRGFRAATCGIRLPNFLVSQTPLDHSPVTRRSAGYDL
jgi:hypothetical protein